MTDLTMACEISEEEERVTPAFLIPLKTCAQEIGSFDHLAHLQLDMKEVKHTVFDKAVTWILNIAIGCQPRCRRWAELFGSGCWWPMSMPALLGDRYRPH